MRKNLKISLMAILAMVLSICLLPVFEVSAKDVNLTYAQQCELLTSSDTYNYANKTIPEPQIQDYPTVYNQYTTNRSQDNPITGIVPRQCFETVGKYFYIGDEYGFFVDTE